MTSSPVPLQTHFMANKPGSTGFESALGFPNTNFQTANANSVSTPLTTALPPTAGVSPSVAQFASVSQPTAVVPSTFSASTLPPFGVVGLPFDAAAAGSSASFAAGLSSTGNGKELSDVKYGNASLLRPDNKEGVETVVSSDQTTVTSDLS